MAIFQLANRDSDLRLEPQDIIIPSESTVVGETILLNITIHNDGQVSGLTSIRVEVVEDGDNRRLIEIVNVEVPAGSSFSFETKWVPEYDGTAWVEISAPDGMNARTDTIQIEKEDQFRNGQFTSNICQIEVENRPSSFLGRIWSYVWGAPTSESI